MQSGYNINAAVESLNTIMQNRQSDPHSGLQLGMMLAEGETLYNVQKSGHVWRLFFGSSRQGEDVELEEVVVSVQGVVSSRDLPPFVQRSKLNPHSLKYLRQSVQITGYSSTVFDKLIECIARINFMFKRKIGNMMSDETYKSNFKGHFALDASNRLFTPHGEIGAGEHRSIPVSIDPTGALRRAAGSTLLYTEDNNIFYLERKATTEDAFRYDEINPQEIHVGDIVEIQVSFVVVPMKKQKSHLSVVLRGITLLDGNHTRDAAMKLQLARTDVIQAQVLKPIKRKIGYIQEEISVARAKLQQMKIDEPEDSDGGSAAT